MEINFSNIWKSPGFSVAGVLSAVAIVTGVLTQHGVTLGNIGNGNWVTLVGAVATALIGLLGTHQAAS